MKFTSAGFQDNAFCVADAKTHGHVLAQAVGIGPTVLTRKAS